MQMVRIASVSNENKLTLESLLMIHNLTYRLDELNNNKGYHVFVGINYELYFREVITPEYKAAKDAGPFFAQQVGRAMREPQDVEVRQYAK